MKKNVIVLKDSFIFKIEKINKQKEQCVVSFFTIEKGFCLGYINFFHENNKNYYRLQEGNFLDLYLLPRKTDDQNWFIIKAKNENNKLANIWKNKLIYEKKVWIDSINCFLNFQNDSQVNFYVYKIIIKCLFEKTQLTFYLNYFIFLHSIIFIQCKTIFNNKYCWKCKNEKDIYAIDFLNLLPNNILNFKKIKLFLLKYEEQEIKLLITKYLIFLYINYGYNTKKILLYLFN